MNKERDSDPDSLDEKTLRRAFELSPPENQGLVYSLYYSYVLQSLVDDEKIVGFRSTEQYSFDDTHGIDFWIMIENGQEVPISITGSKSDKSRRLKKHPDIPTIHIRKNLYKKGEKTGIRTRSVPVLKEETMEKIEKYLKDLDNSFTTAQNE